MSKKRWSLYNTYKFVKEAREMIKPHKLYLDQLRELDKRLFGIYSTPGDYLAMSFYDGKLIFGQESITSTERSAYASSQISEMTFSELSTYYKNQSLMSQSIKMIHNSNHGTNHSKQYIDNEYKIQSPNKNMNLKYFDQSVNGVIKLA